MAFKSIRQLWRTATNPNLIDEGHLSQLADNVNADPLCDRNGIAWVRQAGYADAVISLGGQSGAARPSSATSFQSAGFVQELNVIGSGGVDVPTSLQHLYAFSAEPGVFLQVFNKSSAVNLADIPVIVMPLRIDQSNRMDFAWPFGFRFSAGLRFRVSTDPNQAVALSPYAMIYGVYSR